MIGFGQSALRQPDFLPLHEDLPVVTEIVDAAEKINAFLPPLDQMMESGLVTRSGEGAPRMDATVPVFSNHQGMFRRPSACHLIEATVAGSRLPQSRVVASGSSRYSAARRRGETLPLKRGSRAFILDLPYRLVPAIWRNRHGSMRDSCKAGAPPNSGRPCQRPADRGTRQADDFQLLPLFRQRS